MKKRRLVLVIVMIAIIACGCQATPETSVVTSKSDGAFETALENVAEEMIAEENAEAMTTMDVKKSYNDCFTSVDGNITYDMSVEIPIPTTALPVLQVTPHTITSDEAKRVANALFGDVVINEYSPEMNRSEIEETILELKQHISDWDALVEYYGGDEVIAQQVTNDYENRIRILEELYQSASDSVDVVPCEWIFYPSTHYDNASLDIGYDDDYTKIIKATAWVDGTPYIYCVCNREASDYRIHNIYAYIDDDMVSQSEKYSAEIITQADVEVILNQVETILEEMDMGSWVIESYDISEGMIDGEKVQVMTVTASPVYNGVKMIHVPQLDSLKSEDAYASNYYYEEITFRFSGGRMTSFEFFGPLDVISIANSDVEVLTSDEAVASFKQQMRLTDITGYQVQGIPAEIANLVPQVTTVGAQVNSAEFGLVRTRIKNNESDFYILPAYVFSGTYIPYYSDGSEDLEWETTFATINAVDGTIINTELGY